MTHALWENVYCTKDESEMSWYQSDYHQSLNWLAEIKAQPSDHLIEVGAGSCGWLTHLLIQGYQHITAIDISSTATLKYQQSMRDKGVNDTDIACVKWMVGDVLTCDVFPQCQLWHDRAVFHFMTEHQQQRTYVDTVDRAVEAGGHILISGFALGGPKHCSGLPVFQHDRSSIQALFGHQFILKNDWIAEHITPWNTGQLFHYFHLIKKIS